MNLFLWIILILFASLILCFLFIYFFIMDERSVRLFYRTIGRDIGGVKLFCTMFFFLQYCNFRNLTIVDFFNQNVKKYPNRVCLIFEDEEWTYKQMDELSNKIAHFFIQQGYRKGDEVALLMENCPDYVCFWLGLGKIGVVTALINTNLKTESLAHSMNSIDMRALIFSQSFDESIENAMPYIEKANVAKFFCYSRKSEKKPFLPFSSIDLNIYLENAPAIPLDPKVFITNFRDKLLYIYTSGTTGLPKAAIITHRRCLNCAIGIRWLTKSDESQIFYNTLPLYHIAGSVFYLGVVLIFGGKMVIKKKFSASNFWKDVVKHKVSICVYIGEICRYLLSQPKVDEETQHSVQIMIGNGLKSHVWKAFQERFQVKKIIEVYGSTEGNINLANFSGKVGSAGFVSRIVPKVQGIYIIKIHPESGEIMRDSRGLCVRCKPGESGELVGDISASHPLRQFDGYLNAAESKRKIIRNCFKHGDMVFASGDIFVMDEDGFLYFNDRLGDTFRWKGENVSSTEVENIISKVLNFASCIVYGVEIPDTEGRIGMVTIEVDDFKKINFEKLYKDIADRLPAYAIPAFLRISSTIEETGTYKLKKANFQEQGYNLENIGDPLYMLDMKKRTYVPLTREMYYNIIKGVAKF